MLDSIQVRRQGAQDFGACYDYTCAMQDLAPCAAVKAHLGRGVLDFNGDRLRLTDWPPVLGCLAINKQLLQVAVSSSYQGPGLGETDSRCRSTLRKKVPVLRSREMTFKLCRAVRECLSVSPNLKTLQLLSLPLRERDLISLTKGLAKSLSLENLSLAHCSIGDVGLEAICQSVKNSASIRTVDFTGCNLTWRGAEHMANIIKHQAMRRHGAAWAESLRYRKPEFEGMGGLRRVTLNCNALIGDRGAAALAGELAEDLWVKAVDLQKCGLSSEGARSLLEALQTNATLCVLDIRSNPLVDKDLVKTVIEKVLMNSEGQPSQYSWIKPPSRNPVQKPSVPKRRTAGSTLRGKATFRIGPRRASTTGGRSPGVPRPRPRPSSDRCIPWRTAARADRQRGLPPGITVAEQSFQAAGTVKVTMETESEDEEDEEEVVTQSPSGLSLQDRITARQYKRIQVELEEIRLRLAEERRARVRAETRLMEYELENARLRSLNFSLSEAFQAPPTGFQAPPTCAASVLEDEAVLDSIESSFNKFHAFLDLLKDAGLGQLASMAGIDQSDFGPLGKPQLSSTVGGPLGRGGAGGGVGDQDAGAPLGGDAHRSFSVDPGAPASPREFLPEFSPREVPPALGSGPAETPYVEEPGGELSPQKGPGSEHGSRGNSSHGKSSHGSGSYGKGTRSVASQPHHSNGDGSGRGSRDDDGSHGYSFDYGSVRSNSHRSNGHRSNGSHSDASARSSLSELSERAGSAGSRGGAGRGGGPEEEEGRPFSGFGTLEQVRSLGSLGGQSDDGF